MIFLTLSIQLHPHDWRNRWLCNIWHRFQFRAPLWKDFIILYCNFIPYMFITYERILWLHSRHWMDSHTFRDLGFRLRRGDHQDTIWEWEHYPHIRSRDHIARGQQRNRSFQDIWNLITLDMIIDYSKMWHKILLIGCEESAAAVSWLLTKANEIDRIKMTSDCMMSVSTNDTKCLLFFPCQSNQCFRSNWSVDEGSTRFPFSLFLSSYFEYDRPLKT